MFNLNEHNTKLQWHVGLYIHRAKLYPPKTLEQSNMPYQEATHKGDF